MSQGIESYVTNNASGGGGGSGISSINGDSSAAQTIVGGTGINVGTTGGTTTITATGGGGAAITALTGDVTATGPGSVAATLASIVTAGTNAKITYNAKGLVTAGAALASGDIPNNAANTSGNAANVTGTVATANGGTGLTAPGANGNVLTSNGSIWTTAPASSGFANPMTASGDMIYGGTAGAGTALPGNTTTTKKFLTQTGNGTVSAAPGWNTIIAADVPTLNQNTTGTASNVTGTVAIANGGTGVTAVPTSATASSFAAYDANKNLPANSFVSGYTTTATAATTTTLTAASTYQQYFTGATTQTVVMPVTSTLVLGQQFQIVNLSSGIVTVQSSGLNTIQAMAANTILILTVVNTALTTAAAWSISYQTGGIIPPTLGGTGVANNAASTLTFVGSFAQTFTRSAASNVTLPITGTLSAIAGVETLTNKTLTTPFINGQKVAWINPNTTYAALVGDDIIQPQSSLAAPFTITLPNSPGTGKVFKIVKTDPSMANIITVSGTSFSRTLNTQNESMTVVYSAANIYQLVEAYIPSVWTTYTPTITGAGTPTSVFFQWKRIGDSCQIRGSFNSGTSTAVKPQISLPGAITSQTFTGTAITALLGGAMGVGSSVAASYSVLYESNVNFVTFGQQSAGTSELVEITNAQNLFNAGTPYAMDAVIPITGWNG